jgi:hypothetical protein
VLKEDRQVLWGLLLVGAVIAVELLIPSLASFLVPEPCETVTEANNYAASNQGYAPVVPLRLQVVRSTDKDKKATEPNRNCDTNGLVAAYTGELAKYTAWLMAATIVLGFVGAIQGFYLRRSVKIAERSLTDLERPYIFVSEFAWTAIKDRQEYLGDLDYITLKYTVSNEGKIPAIIDHIWSHISVGTSPDIVGTSSISRQIQILPPGKRWETSDSVHETLMEAKTVIEYGGCTEYRIPRHLVDESVFFQCVITYHGPFTNGHETSACLRCEDMSLSFEEFGGVKFNYIR